jgi:hypothetical protein
MAFHAAAQIPIAARPLFSSSGEWVRNELLTPLFILPAQKYNDIMHFRNYLDTSRRLNLAPLTQKELFRRTGFLGIQPSATDGTKFAKLEKAKKQLFFKRHIVDGFKLPTPLEIIDEEPVVDVNVGKLLREVRKPRELDFQNVEFIITRYTYDPLRQFAWDRPQAAL